MKNELSKKIERWKLKGELFLKENKKVFIKDINNQYFFADILKLDKNTIELKCFAPEEKKDQKFILYWIDITHFTEYKPRGESNESN